jgi:hypothetical protein
MNTVRCLINSNSAVGLEFAIASSQAFLDEYDRWLQFGGLIDVTRFPIDSVRILAPYDFNYLSYASDLFADNAPDLHELRSTLTSICGEFQPDVVLCMTENSVVTEVFGPDRVLFFERGPLPRWNGRDNYYFDVGGHQRRSLLVDQWERIMALPIAEQAAEGLAAEFRARLAGTPIVQDASGPFRRWLDRAAPGRKVAIIAHQPGDSLLVAGSAAALAPDQLVMKVGAELPKDWVAVSTYHADIAAFAEGDEYLARLCPNVLALPPQFRSLGTDPLSGEVDAVITVGSKAAFPAALLGKPVVTLGQCMMRRLGCEKIADLDAAQGLSPVQAGKVLAFLSNRYTMSFEDCFERSGYFAGFLQRFLRAPDKVEFMFDMADWTPARLGYLFGDPC